MLAAFLQGCTVRGDSKEAERVEVAEGGTCYQGLLLQALDKSFSMALE